MNVLSDTAQYSYTTCRNDYRNSATITVTVLTPNLPASLVLHLLAFLEHAFPES